MNIILRLQTLDMRYPRFFQNCENVTKSGTGFVRHSAVAWPLCRRYPLVKGQACLIYPLGLLLRPMHQ